jgi:hypothetical protein
MLWAKAAFLVVQNSKQLPMLLHAIEVSKFKNITQLPLVMKILEHFSLLFPSAAAASRTAVHHQPPAPPSIADLHRRPLPTGTGKTDTNRRGGVDFSDITWPRSLSSHAPLCVAAAAPTQPRPRCPPRLPRRVPRPPRPPRLLPAARAAARTPPPPRRRTRRLRLAPVHPTLPYAGAQRRRGTATMPPPSRCSAAWSARACSHGHPRPCPRSTSLACHFGMFVVARRCQPSGPSLA